MNWTENDSKEWVRLLGENPTLAKGLAIIEESVRPRIGTYPAVDGFDYTPIFVKQSGYYEGVQTVIDKIKSLSGGSLQQKQADPLPEPFSHIKKEK